MNVLNSGVEELYAILFSEAHVLHKLSYWNCHCDCQSYALSRKSKKGSILSCEVNIFMTTNQMSKNIHSYWQPNLMSDREISAIRLLDETRFFSWSIIHFRFIFIWKGAMPFYVLLQQENKYWQTKVDYTFPHCESKNAFTLEHNRISQAIYPPYQTLCFPPYSKSSKFSHPVFQK